MFVKNIENNLPFIQDHNQEVIDDFNSYNYNASERGIRRSEIRFLMGTQHFFLCPTLVTRRKKNIFLWLQFSLTMSPHCGSLLSMVTGHLRLQTWNFLFCFVTKHAKGSQSLK